MWGREARGYTAEMRDGCGIKYVRENPLKIGMREQTFFRITCFEFEITWDRSADLIRANTDCDGSERPGPTGGTVQLRSRAAHS